MTFEEELDRMYFERFVPQRLSARDMAREAAVFALENAARHLAEMRPDSFDAQRYLRAYAGEIRHGGK